jgi:hypothetical protein
MSECGGPGIYEWPNNKSDILWGQKFQNKGI